MARSLCLHKGATRRDMQQIRQDKLPEPMGPRHFPIPHATVYDIAKERLKEGGYEVRWEEHSTTADSSRYFGLLGIANGESSDERERVVGLRNANAQTFGTEGVAGDSVFVCDNLMFSGEVKIGRKHTRNQIGDLPILMDKMVGYLGAAWDNQAERVAAFKERPLSKEEAHDLVCEAYRCGALPTSKIASVLEEWDAPSHEDFEPRNLWSLFNGYTEVAKAWSGHTLQDRSIKMVGMLDEYVGHRAIKPLMSTDEIDPTRGEVFVTTE